MRTTYIVSAFLISVFIVSCYTSDASLEQDSPKGLTELSPRHLPMEERHARIVKRWIFKEKVLVCNTDSPCRAPGRDKTTTGAPEHKCSDEDKLGKKKKFGKKNKSGRKNDKDGDKNGNEKSKDGNKNDDEKCKDGGKNDKKKIFIFGKKEKCSKK